MSMLKKGKNKKKKGKSNKEGTKKKKKKHASALLAPSAGSCFPAVGPCFAAKGIAIDEDGLEHHPTVGLVRVKEPSKSHEGSRDPPQVLCRSGVKKSKSVKIPHGLGQKCATREEAMAMGGRWIAFELARQMTPAGS